MDRAGHPWVYPDYAGIVCPEEVPHPGLWTFCRLELGPSSCAAVFPFACGSAGALPLTLIATPPGMSPCFTSAADGRWGGAASEACTQRKQHLAPEGSQDMLACSRLVTKDLVAEVLPLRDAAYGQLAALNKS